jgi:hypothetical protein
MLLTGYLSCDMPAHLLPLCELPSSREHGCATIRLHQRKTEICGMFLCAEGVQHAEIQHMFMFFLIVVLPCMLTITQLLLQQNAHFYY